MSAHPASFHPEASSSRHSDAAPIRRSPVSRVAALPGVAAGPTDEAAFADDEVNQPQGSKPTSPASPLHTGAGAIAEGQGQGQGLERKSSRLRRLSLTLVRSTDAHPPHHAHFDLPEGSERDRGSSDRDGSGRRSASPRFEPHHRDHSLGTAGNGVGKGVVDIEHVPVDDDPREWSDGKKNFVLALLTISVLGPLIAPSIYNPVIDDVMADLSASQTEIGLSISLYILFQGCIPVLWASIAEITGRKIIYLASYAIYLVGAVVASRAQGMPLFIAMRCLQACGSSAVVAVGAGSLADMFDAHERGQKLGIFYGMPLVGPAIGPLIGGALGNAFGWRSALYFLAVYAFLCLMLFFFFPDTWRRERSRVYQKAMERAVRRAILHDEAREKKRARKAAKGLASNAPTPPTTGMPTPEMSRRASLVGGDSLATATTAVPDSASTGLGSGSTSKPHPGPSSDPEKGATTPASPRRTLLARLGLTSSSRTTQDEDAPKIQPGWRDINPFPIMLSIFRQPANAVVLFASGILFSAQYTVVYTAAVTLARDPYAYNALHIGLVLLSFGVGSMAGSLGGGKYSDVVLRRMREANGGRNVPEMRLKAIIPAVPFLVASFLAYGWTADKGVHISAIIITLLSGGCALMVIYAGTLAYLVDSNPGRSAGAVSCNSFVRGSIACVLSQVAIPIQNAIGDGGLYTIFGGLLALSGCCMFLIALRGEEWRTPGHKWSLASIWRGTSKPLDEEKRAGGESEEEEGGAEGEGVMGRSSVEHIGPDGEKHKRP